MNTPASLSLLPLILKRVWLQILLLCVLLSGHVGLEFLPKVKDHASIAKAISFLAVWVVVWGLNRILKLVKDTPFVESHLSPNIRGIAFNLLRIALFALAIPIALDAIGVSITPLLASLGIGSIAVGLALQDTLGNLISGAYLYLDRPIAVGDWIRLDTGLEGQVVRIGWRTTRLVSNDNMVVIPNSKLSSAIMTNLNLPVADLSVPVAVSVSYDSDLEQVERVLIEVGKEFLKGFPNGMPDREPLVRFQNFGDSSISLLLLVRVQTYVDQFAARHELVKAIKARFDRENIKFPYPRREIHTVST